MTEAFEIKEDKLIAFHLREEVVCVPEGVRVIGTGAFKGCTSMKQILLPATLERIEAHAFKGCRKLESVSFPENLNYIGAYAFHRCHHLKEIRLPEKVTELSDCAFLYCDQLELAVLPGVRSLGKQAFVNATSLKKLVISSELLPECISDSFTGCTRITEISIIVKDMSTIKDANNTTTPASNTHIDTYLADSFIDVISNKNTETPEIIRAIAADIYNMMDIEHGVLVEFHVEPKEVVIPEGIREIGKSCFFNKRGILQMTLPKSLEKIGERAFRNCMNLEHIILQNPHTQIQKDAFWNCTSLKQVTINGISYSLTGLFCHSNPSVPMLVNQIHTQLLGNFCISGTVLLRYWGNEARVTIPDGITVIGERAFAGNEAVGKLILPESVVEIQREAFADCLVLQTLNFPKGLKRIGDSAWEGCVKLLRAEIPAKVTHLGASVFSRCRKLRQVIWEEGSQLSEIGQQAFYGCHELNDLIFPETLEKIGTLAFYQCYAFKKLILPKAVWQIGAEAFACCNGLREVVIKGNLTQCGRNIFAYAKKLKKLTFCEEQESIPDFMAWHCSQLQQVIVPDSLKKIGLSAFEGTVWKQTLDRLNIWGTIFLDGKECSGDIVITEGITAIASGAFYGNHQITSIQLPETVEWIGKRAFCNCTELKEIRLPKKVTVLSEGVFAYCSHLERIDAEGAIKEIEEKACYQCENLQEVPALYQTKIGNEAFRGCRSWKNGVIVGTQIGAYSFEGTGFFSNDKETNWVFDPVQERFFYRTAVIIDHTIVDGSRATGEVIIPAISAIAPYAYYANQQITRIILPDGLKEIGAFAFCGCTRLCEVVLPDSVERIGDSAFEKCTQLITFSSLATKVGKRALACNEMLRFVSLPKLRELQKETLFHCSQLERLEIPEVEQIEEGCFKNCIALKNVSFDKTKKIGEEAFSGCETLSELTIGSETQIAAYAFCDCCNLTKVTLTDPFIELDSRAFCGCTFLEEIRIADQTYSILGYEDLFRSELPELVRNIYASAISCFVFQNTKAIAAYRTNACAIRIPNGVRAILGEVFKDCIHLEHVELPESVTYIGERAFWGTKWLKQKKEENPFVISNQILLDGASANGCVVIPKEVQMISGWAFANCYGLSAIVFRNPKLVIEPHTFRNCIYLKQVTAADGTVYNLDGISVRTKKDIPNLIRQIFEDALNCYKTDEAGVLIECTGNITNFALVRGITAIGAYVFQDSNLLTDARLTEDVKWIGESAFARCKWLRSLCNADGVKEIGAMAFSGCIRLEQAVFSEQLIQIGKRAFENCTLLQEIRLPEGIQEIPERAFFRCKSLKKLVLPQSLEQIGEEAFAFCESLTEVILPNGLQKIAKRAFAWCKKLDTISIPKGTEVTERAFEFSAFLPEDLSKE